MGKESNQAAVTEECWELQRRFPEVFRCEGGARLLITVPPNRVAWDLFFFGAAFLAFFLLGEFITFTGSAPRPVLLMPLPLLLLSLALFAQWAKWRVTGQVVRIEVEPRGAVVEIEDRLLGLLPVRRRVRLWPPERSPTFQVAPYVVYRSGSGPASTPHTKGYQVRVRFPKRKILWVLELDSPRIGIGAYLTGQEAHGLARWLNRWREFRAH